MNFKRVAALLLAGAMVMTAVPVYAKGDDVTLSVSIWDTNQEPGIKEILADFTEKTGIKTEISVVKWDEYWTMLEAGAQGGWEVTSSCGDNLSSACFCVIREDLRCRVRACEDDGIFVHGLNHLCCNSTRC